MNEAKKDYTILGEHTPVVLLHSSLSSKAQWQRLTSQLSPQFKTIAIDLYGYGAAPFPDPHAAFALQNEVVRIQDILNAVLAPQARFHLIGHSYGAAVALRLCYQQQNNISSLTLFEPVAFHLLPKTDPALHEIETLKNHITLALQQEDYEAAAACFVDYWNTPNSYHRLPTRTQSTLANAIKKIPFDFNALMHDPYSIADYQKINTPTCLLAGKQTRLPARHVRDLLAASLPHCQQHWVSGGHMSPITHADEVNNIMMACLKSFTTSHHSN